MKIFKMDDYEYWAAEDLDAAKQAFIAEYGTDAESVEDACELSAAEYEAINVDQSEHGDGSGPMISPRALLIIEIAQGGQFPRMVYAHDS